MAKIIPIEDIQRSVKLDDEGKKDRVILLKDIEYNDGSGRIVIKDREDQFEDEVDFSATGRQQFWNRMNIPSAYAAKLEPTILKKDFDYWKESILGVTPDVSLLFRNKKTDSSSELVRAVLSDNYGIIDNAHVVDALSMVNAESRNSLICRDLNISADMFNARLVFNDLIDYGTDPNGRNNPFFAGIHISNGETGGNKVCLDLLIWEQFCSNGAIRQHNKKSLFARRHVGKATLLNDFNAVIAEARSLSEATMESFKDSRHVILADPMTQINTIMQINKDTFPLAFRPKVIEEFEARPENGSYYGIASAMTRAAQQLPYDGRLAVERVAGDIIFGRKAV